jgi:hypothetical protein
MFMTIGTAQMRAVARTLADRVLRLRTKMMAAKNSK